MWQITLTECITRKPPPPQKKKKKNKKKQTNDILGLEQLLCYEHTNRSSKYRLRSN